MLKLSNSESEWKILQEVKTLKVDLTLQENITSKGFFKKLACLVLNEKLFLLTIMGWLIVTQKESAGR
jgi:hypothetical protein